MAGAGQLEAALLNLGGHAAAKNAMPVGGEAAPPDPLAG